LVVDRRVDEVVADPSTPRGAGGAAVGAVAAAIRDAAQLLDVDVNQFARPGALIAADQLASGPVHGGQPVEAVTVKDAMDRRGGPADPWGDAGRAELAGPAQPADLGLHRGGHSVGMGVGGTGPVVKAGLAVLAVADPPAIGGGAGDAHLGGDVGGEAATGDALAQDQPSRWGEAGVSVGHEDLRVVSRQTAPPRPEVPPSVNNPRGQYT
jgi:hypothetical protein